jgi:predicted small secreted protein
MRKLMIASLLTASLALTACNTVRGLGRDMESVGSAVEQAAN